MNDPATVAQRQQAREQGLIATLITLPFRLFGVLCGSLLLCILIECVGLHFFWPEQRWHHAQGMLNYELDQLSSYFTRSVLVQEPGRTAHQWVERAYKGVFVKTGLLDSVHETSEHARAGSDSRSCDFRCYLGQVYLHLEDYVMASIYSLLTFLVRLFVLCLMLPLFVMAAFAGVVDGLVRRDVRRFNRKSVV